MTHCGVETCKWTIGLTIITSIDVIDRIGASSAQA
jgi:hypothetical protein